MRRCESIVVDSKDQARIEAGDFVQAASRTGSHQLVRRTRTGPGHRRPGSGRSAASDMTLFKSLGVAIEDVATAARVVARAKENKVGTWIDW